MLRTAQNDLYTSNLILINSLHLVTTNCREKADRSLTVVVSHLKALMLE